MNKKVLIVGGSGFIGYHVCNALIQKGYEVTAITFEKNLKNVLPNEVLVINANINLMTDLELEKLFENQGYFIFAAGLDDRAIVKRPAYNFFYNANVKTLERLLLIAKSKDVKKVVICNSYFAYFNRLWPEMHLAEIHPYIRSRKDQQEMAFRVAGDNMPVAIMELPYIVGVTPNKGSLWEGLVKYVNKGFKFKFYTSGGTAVVSVGNVAEAIVNSLELTTENACYQIVDINMTWKDWLNALRADKTKEIIVVTVPKFLLKIGAFFLNIMFKLKNEEPGLSMNSFIDLQTKNTFLPIEESKKRLKYGSYNIEEDFEYMIELCLKD